MSSTTNSTPVNGNMVALAAAVDQLVSAPDPQLTDDQALAELDRLDAVIARISDLHLSRIREVERRRIGPNRTGAPPIA